MAAVGRRDVAARKAPIRDAPPGDDRTRTGAITGERHRRCDDRHRAEHNSDAEREGLTDGLAHQRALGSASAVSVASQRQTRTRRSPRFTTPSIAGHGFETRQGFRFAVILREDRTAGFGLYSMPQAVQSPTASTTSAVLISFTPIFSSSHSPCSYRPETASRTSARRKSRSLAS